MSLYLLLNLASISVPFIYSFEKRMRFIKIWKEVFLAISIVGFIFIVWDIIFTKLGIWGFNETYLVGLHILNLPIEEWLFFICIPYASIFTHYAFRYFLPKVFLNTKLTKYITISLIVILFFVVINNLDKMYTLINFSFLLIILIYSLFMKREELGTFYISFLIILIPFFFINGILTGSFLDAPVVWYNNNENLGIRLGTVPIEDVGYAFNLLFLNILLIEKFKNRP